MVSWSTNTKHIDTKRSGFETPSCSLPILPRPSAIVSGSQHLPEGAAPPQGGRRTSPAMDRCAKGEGGVWVNLPGGRGPPLQRVRFPSFELKVVSGRHSDTRKRPVRSGYSVAKPKALQYCARASPVPDVHPGALSLPFWGGADRNEKNAQALPFVYPPSKSLCFVLSADTCLGESADNAQTSLNLPRAHRSRSSRDFFWGRVSSMSR